MSLSLLSQISKGIPGEEYKRGNNDEEDCDARVDKNWNLGQELEPRLDSHRRNYKLAN